MLPSCKRLHNYGKSPLFMGKSTISMANFNVSLAEGTQSQLKGEAPAFSQRRKLSPGDSKGMALPEVWNYSLGPREVAGLVWKNRSTPRNPEMSCFPDGNGHKWYKCHKWMISWCVPHRNGHEFGQPLSAGGSGAKLCTGKELSSDIRQAAAKPCAALSLQNSSANGQNHSQNLVILCYFPKSPAAIPRIGKNWLRKKGLVPLMHG